MLPFASCSENSSNQGIALFGASDGNKHSEYLAYAHNIDIATAKDTLDRAHSTLVEKCNSDETLGCTILYSDVSRSDYPSASLRLRVIPSAVEPLITLAGEVGVVRRNSTTVEDLAEPIRDTKGNIKKLRSHLTDLENLRTQSKSDIRALIAVTAEIAKVTSQLETALGQEAHLLERVELQILNINFSVDRRSSFFAPIGHALSEFSDDLSEGIAQAISGFAYLLPWLVVLIPLLMFVRFLWRKLK